MSATEIAITIVPTLGSSVALNQNLGSSGFYVLRNTSEILSTLSTRKTDRNKQGAHGSEDSLSFYEARILPFEGELHADTQANRVTMEQALKAALALPIAQSYDENDGYVLVQITDEDSIAKQLYAKILEPPKFEVIDSGMPESRRFEFVLYAKDPVIYAQALTSVSDTESFDGTTFTFVDGDLPTFKDGDLPTFQDVQSNLMTVNNTGNYGSPPVFTVTGPTTDPVIENITTGKKMEFSKGGGLTLTGSQTLTVNVLDGTIIKTSGATETDVSGTLSDDSEWIFLQPGTNVFRLYDDTVDDLTAQLAVDFRPAWI
jgi:hypothetical protein